MIFLQFPKVCGSSRDQYWSLRYYWKDCCRVSRCYWREIGFFLVLCKRDVQYLILILEKQILFTIKNITYLSYLAIVLEQNIIPIFLPILYSPQYDPVRTTSQSKKFISLKSKCCPFALGFKVFAAEIKVHVYFFSSS